MYPPKSKKQSYNAQHNTDLAANAMLQHSRETAVLPSSIHQLTAESLAANSVTMKVVRSPAKNANCTGFETADDVEAASILMRMSAMSAILETNGTRISADASSSDNNVTIDDGATIDMEQSSSDESLRERTNTRSGGYRLKAKPEYDMKHHPLDNVVGFRRGGRKGRPE